MADTNIDSDQGPSSMYGMYPQSDWSRRTMEIKGDPNVLTTRIASLIARAEQVEADPNGPLVTHYKQRPGEFDRLAGGLRDILENTQEVREKYRIDELLETVTKYTATVEADGGLPASNGLKIGYDAGASIALVLLASYAWSRIRS